MPEPSLDAYKRFTTVRVEALNQAIKGLPPDRIRFHLCWGSWHGPHTHDIPLRHIIDLILRVKAQSYSFEAGNVRHEHEWKVWKDVKLPAGMTCTGCVLQVTQFMTDHGSNTGGNDGYFYHHCANVTILPAAAPDAGPPDVGPPDAAPEPRGVRFLVGERTGVHRTELGREKLSVPASHAKDDE